MIRSTLILIVSSVVLLLLYAGYNMIVVPTAPSGGGNSGTGGAGLSKQQPIADDSVYKVEAGGITAEVAPGQTISFTRYDEKTGRPTQTLSCEEWRKAPGSDRDFILKAPQLEMILPSGMVARVTAAEGTISADRVRERKVEPRSGTLRGNARIAIDRRPSDTRSLAAPQADDMFTIETDELSFDLERGFLKSTSRVQATSDLFEMRGFGLELLWNQAANRIETLVVDRGEELVLYIDGGMLGGLGRMVDSQPASEAAGPDALTAAASRPGEPKRERRIISYMCTLDGGIVADHYLWTGERDAGLEADELRLTFDLGGGAGRVLQGDRARRPGGGLKDRLVVRWNGRFAIGPVETPAKLTEPRRQIEISGREVKLDLKDSCIVCGKLDYHEQTQRLWLTAAPNRPIELGLGEGLRADADGVFVDQKARIVKLLGDVRLGTRSGLGKSAINLACDLWAELRLDGLQDDEMAASVDEEVTDVLRSSMRLKSALLVGDVRAGLEDQEIRSGRLEAFFRPPVGKEPIEQLLQRVVAAGSVRINAQRESQWPRWIDALSAKATRPLTSVRRSLSPQSLECDWVELGVSAVAAAGPAPATRAASPRPSAGGPALATRVQASTLEARGDVRLRDALRKVEAYGQSLTALFLDGNRIATAVVGGTPSDPARLQAASYDVRGRAIEINPQAETLTVPGHSTLQLASDRGLRGERRAQPQWVTVESRQRLKVDNKANQVEFLGEVEARSGSDRLVAESMVLLLQEAAAPSRSVRRPAGAGLFREIGSRLARGSGPGAGGALGSGLSRGSQRKEPVKLIARAALVESSLYEQGDPIAVLYQTINAPELEVDLPRRTIRTTGLTQLMMTDRRLDTDADGARDASGLPSALLTRGPSQTAMKCENSLLYVIGEESTSRRDSIVFDGRVRMRHVAGKEMVNINELFPTFASNPEQLEKLKSRNTLIEADRIEGTLEGGSRRPQSGLTPGVRLAWLNARGNVYMMDKQGAGVREVHATQLEFDRPQQIVRVLGSTNPRVDARVTYVNAKNQQADAPWFGTECTIDLANNTIRTGASQGEFRRR